MNMMDEILPLFNSLIYFCLLNTHMEKIGHNSYPGTVYLLDYFNCMFYCPDQMGFIPIQRFEKTQTIHLFCFFSYFLVHP